MALKITKNYILLCFWGKKSYTLPQNLKFEIWTFPHFFEVLSEFSRTFFEFKFEFSRTFLGAKSEEKKSHESFLIFFVL